MADGASVGTEFQSQFGSGKHRCRYIAMLQWEIQVQVHGHSAVGNTGTGTWPFCSGKYRYRYMAILQWEIQVQLHGHSGVGD